MSEITDFDTLKPKKGDAGGNDDGSDDESIGIEKIVDNDDASTDGDQAIGSDYESEDDTEMTYNLDGAYEDDVQEQGFITKDDDDESVSTTDSGLSDESGGEGYFQKFDSIIRDSIVDNYHPECVQSNYDEVNVLCGIVRNDDGIIVDPFHKTYPILSKFEKTRVLGLRAKQLNEGAKPFVEVNQGNYDGYVLANRELTEKKIPFIIRRPLPNGVSEYWRLQDLELV